MRNKFFTVVVLAVVLSGCSAANGDKNSVSSGDLSYTTSESSLSQISQETESKTEELFAMDTYMSLTAYGENSETALKKAKEFINKTDSILSVGDQNSDVYKLNNEGNVKASDITAELFKRSLEISGRVEGAFDPTVYPLMELWGFTDKNYKVPNEEEIKSTLAKTGLSKVEFNEATGEISFDEKGMGIDFGAVAKGYTSAEIMDIFKENGVSSGMVSLGGNVQVLGTKPDGSLWRVAVQNPNTDENYLGVLEVKDCAVITSGGYERYFDKDGKRYHHILDPKTGYPSENGLTSVTIISSDGTLADGYSTSLFVMGLEKAQDFWRNNSSDFDAVFCTNEGKIYVTEGISESFSSDSDFEVVKKEG